MIGYLQWAKSISNPTSNYWQNSLATAAEAPSLKTQSAQVIVMKQGIPFGFDKLSMETETEAWSEFPDGEKVVVEQMLASEETDKSYKSRTMRDTIKDASRKVNHLCNVIW